MKRIAGISWLVVLCFCSISAAGYNTAAETSIVSVVANKEIQNPVWLEMVSSESSSATVAVMNHGKIVYSEQFGLRDRETFIAANRQTQFNIGSISKVITTAAMLILVDRGMVALEKPVTAYLPEFTMPDMRYQDITVRMLLNHSSALPGTNFRNAFGTLKNLNYIKETLSYLSVQLLKHTPGEISVYCNDGFTLAEAIIERVSGMSYADYVRINIFVPLLMWNTSSFFKKGNDNIATVYNGNMDPMPTEYVSALATGGISSTAEDLCRFSSIIYSDAVLSSGAREAFTKAHYASDTAAGENPYFHFGLGWDSVSVHTFSEQGIRVLGKSGGTIEFSSYLLVAPEQNITVAVIFAGPNADAASVAETIMQFFLQASSAVPIAENKRLPAPAPASIPNSLLPYAGIYGTSTSVMKIDFNIDSNTMQTQEWNGKRFIWVDSSQYKDDGYFHSASGNRYLIKEHEGSNVIFLVEGELEPRYLIVAERLSALGTLWTGERFANKRWLFRNATKYDFILNIADTGTITALPGYIYFDSLGMMPCVLDNENLASICMNYARDLLTVMQWDMRGEQWIYTGNFLYSDARNIQSLPSEGDTITIGPKGWNEWRIIAEEVIFSCSIPEEGRIIIYSQTKEMLFDSLEETATACDVTPNSYVVFIGPPGMSFPAVTFTHGSLDNLKP